MEYCKIHHSKFYKKFFPRPVVVIRDETTIGRLLEPYILLLFCKRINSLHLVIRPFGRQDAGVEFKILNLERLLTEKAVAGEEICDFLHRAVFQAGKRYMR